MSYSLQLLATQADCQTLLTMIAKEKSDLEFRKLSLSRQRGSATETSTEINTELIFVNAEISALDTVIAALPDGPTKEDNIMKRAKLAYRKLLLEDRKGNYGVVSLLEKEYDIACIEKDLQESDVFSTAVTTRMGEL